MRTIRTLMAALLWGTVATHAAPDPERIPPWDTSDETNTATISHQAWQELLDAHLKVHPSGINPFDYGSLKADAEHRKQLQSYLSSLVEIDPRSFAKAEQMAYWINLYNALTVFVIVGRYPVDSIKDISSSLFSYGPWELELITLQGEPLTLDDIEHRILPTDLAGSPNPLRGELRKSRMPQPGLGSVSVGQP